MISPDLKTLPSASPLTGVVLSAAAFDLKHPVRSTMERKAFSSAAYAPPQHCRSGLTPVHHYLRDATATRLA
eukprot:scaffold57288_cov17-Prasinocladus_malaysianus.AAC.1